MSSLIVLLVTLRKALVRVAPVLIMFVIRLVMDSPQPTDFQNAASRIARTVALEVLNSADLANQQLNLPEPIYKT